ncbi:MAG: PEP-CTERM sorting domain-containing protein [Phycisphaerales bacterium]|nr:MAG: PEP-CTERM sorting domain-containing protein [Phycisphaerales bacterium]
MMKRLGLVVLLVCFLSGSVFASNDFSGVGNWSNAEIWSQGYVPTGEEEVKVRGDETICTLNTSTGDWGVGRRMRVYEGATLIVEDGAELLGAGWMRVGASNPGYVEQTGGLVSLQTGRDDSRLVIGDSGGSDGLYTISGGTLTYDVGEGDGHLTLGDRGGMGKFTVSGSGSVIQMGSLRVGGREASRAATGTLEFLIDGLGVTPIQVNDVFLDPAGDDSTATLIVDLLGIGDADLSPTYLLVENLGDNPVNGIFDGMPEGTGVTLDTTVYNLTYVGGVGGNDIMLIPEPATLLLFGLGGLVAFRRRRS